MKLLTIQNIRRLYNAKIQNKSVTSIYPSLDVDNKPVYVIELDGSNPNASYAYIAIHREILSPYETRYVKIIYKTCGREVDDVIEIKLLVSSFATMDKFLHRLDLNLSNRI